MEPNRFLCKRIFNIIISIDELFLRYLDISSCTNKMEVATNVHNLHFVIYTFFWPSFTFLPVRLPLNNAVKQQCFCGLTHTGSPARCCCGLGGLLNFYGKIFPPPGTLVTPGTGVGRTIPFSA